MAAWHNAEAAGAGGEPEAAVSAAGVGSSGASVVDEVATADGSVTKSGWLSAILAMAGSGVASRVIESAAAAAVPEGDQRQGYKRQFQQGVTLFNQQPKKGIAYMQEQGLVGLTAGDVSQFLARTQGLK
jgi:hypothetical protein